MQLFVVTHSFINSLTHSLTSLTHSLTHSLTLLTIGVYVFAANSIFIGIAMHGTFVLNILVPILIPFVVFILLIWMYIYLVLDRKGTHFTHSPIHELTDSLTHLLTYSGGLWEYAKFIKKNKM